MLNTAMSILRIIKKVLRQSYLTKMHFIILASSYIPQGQCLTTHAERYKISVDCVFLIYTKKSQSCRQGEERKKPFYNKHDSYMRKWMQNAHD